jgi:hypothetical protein
MKNYMYIGGHDRRYLHVHSRPHFNSIIVAMVMLSSCNTQNPLNSKRSPTNQATNTCILDREMTKLLQLFYNTVSFIYSYVAYLTVVTVAQTIQSRMIG